MSITPTCRRSPGQGATEPVATAEATAEARVELGAGLGRKGQEGAAMPLGKLRVADLRDRLAAVGASTLGKKAELVQRLRAATDVK